MEVSLSLTSDDSNQEAVMALSLYCRATMIASLVALSGATRMLGDEAPTLTPARDWHSVFGGSQVAWRERLHAPQATEGTLEWSFAVGPRTVARGEVGVKLQAGETFDAKLLLRIPPVKPEVVLGAQLTTFYRPLGAQEVTATAVRPIWVFPEEAFVGRESLLEKLKIALFDPSGNTAAAFDKWGIPYQPAANTAALAAVEDGLIVVGEGVSLDEERGLADTIAELVLHGRQVLCLAPKASRCEFPSQWNPSKLSHAGLSVRGSEVILDLDKRLDSRAWFDVTDLTTGRLALVAEGDRIELAVTNDPAGWPWLEVKSANRTCLIFCGFEIIRHWESGPTPRYLLVRIFERVAGIDDLQAIPVKATISTSASSANENEE